MTNPFYNPSGNPATGSEGLSALMRAEFAAIANAFGMLPAFTTTGAFTTIFNQHGNYTFDLPGFPGTLAAIADVEEETTRAEAAEAANTTAINAEVTARTAAVAAETSRATAAEGANATAITAEQTARIAADSAETTRATAAETANANAITAETAARVAGDNAEASARTTAIAAEATARTTAITAETTRAEAAEAANATAIATETTRAKAAEAALTLFTTLHNETGVRVAGTTYVNSTGKPMIVSIAIVIFNTGPDMNFFIDNTLATTLSRINGVGTVYAIVPNGLSYKTDPNTGTNWQGSITSWTETW